MSSRDLSIIPSSGRFFRSFFIVFFAALFFLGSADQFFTTHLGGFNFRWGQLLLLAAAAYSLWGLRKKAARSTPHWAFQKKLFQYWAPFFAVYLLTGLMSPSPELTLIKWGWGLFNIGLTAVVCLDPRWKGSLERGFLYGFLAIALVVWVESITLDWFDFVPATNEWHVSFPLWVHWAGFPTLLGYAQSTYHYAGRMMWRPNAFNYESSYTGCALAFAFPLALAVQCRSFGVKAAVFSSFILSAVILVSSRSGILSLVMGLLCLILFAAWKKDLAFRTMVLKTVLFGFLWLGLFCLSPIGRNQMCYTFGLFQEHMTEDKLTDPTTSEGGRVAALIHGLHAWKDHFLFGNGISKTQADPRSRLGATSDNTWLEVAIESGTVGLLCFGLALGLSIKKALSLHKKWILTALVMAAWFSHFLVDLNLTQTFPRLDYWLLFFLSLRLLVLPSEDQKVSR